MTEVGARFRALREASGLSLLEVAERVGVSEGTLSRWETGKIDPPASRLAPWGAAVGASVYISVRPGRSAHLRPDQRALVDAVLDACPSLSADETGAVLGMLRIVTRA